MLPLDPITAGISLITGIVSRVWPDKSESEKAQLAMAMQQDANLTQLLIAQANINANEANSNNLFIAGWRPFIGWICGSAFAWAFVVQPILIFVGTAVGHPIDLPAFNLSEMSTVLMGMLGLGGMRTYEKIQNVHGRH